MIHTKHPTPSHIITPQKHNTNPVSKTHYLFIPSMNPISRVTSHTHHLLESLLHMFLLTISHLTGKKVRISPSCSRENKNKRKKEGVL